MVPVAEAERMPDTILVRLDGSAVARADIFAHVPGNQYCYDCEYYLVLRLRELLDPAAWRTLPWGQTEHGDVFLAYDKFHGLGGLTRPGRCSTAPEAW